ncbi:MAG: class IV adenylate cyclase [Patescibacteria group bacterium]|nr:class IV adenylate cyclase [Patescibacteria group bacterium]
MEIELRARIENKEVFQENLNSLSDLKIISMGERQIDTYLKHASDIERILVLRIRRKDNGAILSFKTKSQGKDVAWHDIDLPLSEPDLMEDILTNSGYIYVVEIDKVRDAYKFQNYEINYDQIRDLGSFVEVAVEIPESESDNKDVYLKKLEELLAKLGCEKQQIIELGYVKLMEQENQSRP